MVDFFESEQERQNRREIMNQGKLIHKDGHEIKVGDEVADFRGDKLIVTGWREGRDSSSTGRVFVKEDGHDREYFPGVIDAHIVSE